MANEALQKAVSIVGSQTALAKACKVSQSYVWNWLHRDGRVPAEFAIPIAAATNFAVKPHDLRSDIYPSPFDCVPPEFSKVAA